MLRSVWPGVGGFRSARRVVTIQRDALFLAVVDFIEEIGITLLHFFSILDSVRDKKVSEIYIFRF